MSDVSIGRGHTFVREDKIDLIGTYLCGSYLSVIDNFNLNFELYLATYLRKIIFHYGHKNVYYLDFSLSKFGLYLVNLMRFFFV